MRIKSLACLLTICIHFCVGVRADDKVTVRQSSVEHSFVSGLENSQLKDRLKGRVLIEELGCVACHTSPDTSLLKSTKRSPRLSDIGKRANPYYLEQFLNSPHSVKKGTTMPNALSHLSPDERQVTATALTHFLVSLQGKDKFAPVVPDSVAAEVGETLFHSVGCVACHSPRDSSGQELLGSSSTPLGNLEKKYNFAGLVQFLADPHRVRPSGRMPNMNLPRRQYEQIAHYLLRETRVPGNLHYTLIKGRVWEGLEVNVEKVKAGHVEDFSLNRFPRLAQNSAIIYEGFLKSPKQGEAKFFLEWNGGELWINEKKISELEPSSRRGIKKSMGKTLLVDGWNKIKLVYFHSGKEPKFQFEMEGPGEARQTLSAARLSISTDKIESYKLFQVDSKLAQKGAEAFFKNGCVQCHDDLKNRQPQDVAYVAPKALHLLASDQGCLGDSGGKSPHFDLSDQQKVLIKAALAESKSAKPLAAQETVNKSLVTFNCIACHDRSELGGVSPERNPLFVGDKNELGNDGRIPPPLTYVGAKLKKEWIAEVMLRGRRQRDYMATTMPQFGESNIGHMIDLFEKVDSIEPVQFEKIKDIGRVKQAGHKLMGTEGFSCIACHDFNGQKAAGPGAMDIVSSTSRLKKDWFYWFMLKPNRFRKGTIMPASWPGGHVFMEDILDGDAKKQIESLWVYLEDGTRAKNPVGLSRKSPELRVTDEALICRGRGTAGYRGMGVGYPERISLAFDTQEMNLRLLWRGEFATVDNGRFFARGRDRVNFPQGIPFHRLESMDDNWPYKRKTDYLFPQDQGYRFDGYTLDKLKRPTLLYRYGDIQVSDFFEDKLDPQKNAYFQRTLTFESPREQEEFFFRVASGAKIVSKSKTSFEIDRLKLSFVGGEGSVIREGQPKELLIRVKVPKGKSTLTLEYKW